MRGTEAVAQILKAEGVEYLFSYPNHPLIDAAARLGIRPLIARGEKTLINMADGYTRTINGTRPTVVVVQAGPQAQPADQVLDLAVVEAFVLVGCAEALGGEPAGDRGVAQALTGQCPDPLGQRRVVRQLVDPGHRAEQAGVGLVAAGPGYGGLDALGGAVGGDLDGLDDGADQPAPLLRTERCGRGGAGRPA